METVQFKTTIKCEGCIAKVTPNLDKVVGAGKWQVDIQNPDKILTVNTEAADAAAVINAVQSAGFRQKKISG